MAIKSALMTTGYDVLDGGRITQPALIFRQGAGHVRPNSAPIPGLVFDAGFNDWLALPVRHRPQRSRCDLHRSEDAGYSRPQRPERRLDRHRRHGGHADRDPQVTNVGSSPATYTRASPAWPASTSSSRRRR